MILKSSLIIKMFKWLRMLIVDVKIDMRGGTQARPCKDIISHQDNIIFFCYGFIIEKFTDAYFR